MTDQVLTPQVSAALEVWAQLLRGNATARRALSAQLDAAHGLTISEFEALQLLSQAEETALRRVDLAEGLGLTASGVTRLLDGLQRAGFVGKRACERDQRVTYAVLTDAGAEKLAAASCSHVAAVVSFLEDRYSSQELTTLADLLGRLSCQEYAS
jgi:DNA-binding MarR family transcriptional regulator